MPPTAVGRCVLGGNHGLVRGVLPRVRPEAERWPRVPLYVESEDTDQEWRSLSKPPLKVT